MTSKARTRGGSVVQATFLFEKEPNEQMPAVATLDPPKARTVRTSRKEATDAVPPAEVVATVEPPKARARRAARTTSPVVLEVQPVAIALEPSTVRTPRAARTKEAAAVHTEAIESETVAPEASSTKRRAAKSTKAVPTASLVVGDASSSEPVVVHASDQVEPQRVEAKGTRKRRVAQAEPVSVEVPSSAPIEAARRENAEPEHIQAKEPRKRRSLRTTVVVPDARVLETLVISDREHVEADGLVSKIQQESDAAFAQETPVKQRRAPRARTARDTKDESPGELVAPLQVADAMPSTNVLAPAEAVSEAVAISDAAPKRARRERSGTATPSSEHEAPLPEKRLRKPRTPVVPEEPKVAATPVLPNLAPREVPSGPMFLMSYDDSPKRTLAEKIEAAMMAYQSRFARRPNLVLVNTNVAPEVELADVAIERRSTVPPNNFWAGMQPIVRAAVVE